MGTVPADSVSVPSDPFNMVPAQIDQGGTAVYQHGGVYTLRGPSAILGPQDLCPNDKLAEEYRKASGSSDRGFIWDSKSTKEIRDAILRE